MNDSEFGLTASIWTKDEDAAVKIGNEIDTGTWFMNRCDCKNFLFVPFFLMKTIIVYLN